MQRNKTKQENKPKTKQQGQAQNQTAGTTRPKPNSSTKQGQNQTAVQQGQALSPDIQVLLTTLDIPELKDNLMDAK